VADVSSLAFAFKNTPELLVRGIFFALAMGIVGGLLPAIRAANTRVVTALRELQSDWHFGVCPRKDPTLS
jgi:putative ABC transport system permease protein